ncbi:MAG: hypothetical protein HXX11_18205 [Desulfuromonadales bacterium]|nr:hypothetical protein [Desulfuromonadales bacterium]
MRVYGLGRTKWLLAGHDNRAARTDDVVFLVMNCHAPGKLGMDNCAPVPDRLFWFTIILE